MTSIPYGRHDINQSDIDAVIEVLRSDFLTQGAVVPAFEGAVAKYCSVQHAVAVNSATSALHIACLSLGVGSGDIVWTSPITFVASANCALYCGATVDFVDIDPQTYNISVQRLREKLVLAEKTGKLPKVVIPVHLCGQSCEMAAICELGQQYGFKIIEDASHAIGGKYKNEPVGNTRYSDIAVFSFHPVKIITTGEGGVAVTNDSTLDKRMRLLRSHGITNTPADMKLFPEDEIWNYQQIDLGMNYRMTDIQAALGLSQISRLDTFVEKRQKIVAFYDAAFIELPVVIPWQHLDTYSSFHLYPIRVRLADCGMTQRDIYDFLRKQGIAVNLHYIPVYLQPYYKSMNFQAGHCPEAEKYFKEAISLPIFPTLTEANQQKVVAALKQTLL